MRAINLIRAGGRDGRGGQSVGPRRSASSPASASTPPGATRVKTQVVPSPSARFVTPPIET